MNRLYRIFLFLSLFIFLQYDVVSQDEAVFHLDKPFYVTGESVFYKAYLPTSFATVSGKVKVVVESSDKTFRNESFVQLSDALITGYFKIPFNVSSDVYRFSFFALDNETFKAIEFTNFDIPIYNDLLDEGVRPIFPNTEPTAIVGDSEGLKVSVSNSSLNVRDEVNLRLAVTDRTGKSIPAQVSVSVTDVSLLGESTSGLTVLSRPITIGDGVNIAFDEKIFVQGKMSDASTDQPVSVSVIGAYNAQKNKMYYTKSNESGDFTILMADQVGESTLQIVGYLYDEVEDTKVVIRKPRSSAPDVSFTNKYDTDVANYIKSSNKRKRIYQFFNQLESDFEVEPISLDPTVVKPNKNYKVKEYVAFENIGRFFGEILGGQLEFNKDGDKMVARTYNPESNRSRGQKNFDYLARSPVFIIDGKMTKSAAFVHDMSLDNIEELDLYYDWRDITKQFGTFGEFGYVLIKTNLADVTIPEADSEDIITFNGVQPQVKYPIAINSVEKSIPVFKPTVFWDPTISLKKSSDGNIKFSASDDISTFVVTVVAQTEDGKIMTGTTSYKTSVQNQ